MDTHAVTSLSPSKHRLWWLTLPIMAMCGVGIFFLTGFVVIQPLGALPDGVTLWTWRLAQFDFIESPDSICERERGGVSLWCRGGMLIRLGNSTDKILLRLPYSERLYLISTGGRTYDR